MKKQNVTFYYGLLMAIYSVAFVAMSAFSSLYLLDIGFSNGDVGILLAVGSLLSVIFQPVIGSMIDRNPRVSTKGVLLLLSSLVVVFGILLMVLPNKSILVSSLIYGVCIMLLMIVQPFLNALGIEAINYGYPMNLGWGKSLGSMGYAAGSYAFGVISVMYGPKSIPVTFSIAFFVLCLLLYFYPVKTLEGKKELTESVKKENPFLFLVRYKRYAVILLGLIFIYFSHVLINTFSLQVLFTKGGNSGDLGTAAAIAAGCELITAFLFSWYMKKIKLNNIIRIAGLFFTLKILFSLIVTNVTGYYIIQVLQMFGWGFMSVGIIYYVNDIVSDHDKAQGQAYAGMSYTIASVIGTFLGGTIIDKFGVDTLLIAGTVIAGLGTLIVWIFATEIKKEK